MGPLLRVQWNLLQHQSGPLACRNPAGDLVNHVHAFADALREVVCACIPQSRLRSRQRVGAFRGGSRVPFLFSQAASLPVRVTPTVHIPAFRPSSMSLGVSPILIIAHSGPASIRMAFR